MIKKSEKINSTVFLRKYFILIAVLLAFSVRSIWLYSNYNIAHDISIQMNIAQNIYDGNGIKATRIEYDSVIYRPKFNYGTVTPTLLATVNCITNNIVKADLLLRLLLALAECILVVIVVFRYFDKTIDRIVLTGTLSLFVGHLDRGFTSDYLSLTVVLATVFLTISSAFQREKYKFRILLLAILVFMLPLVKYSSLPVFLLPLSVHLINYSLSGRKIFNNREVILLSSASFMSFFVLFFLIGDNVNASFSLDRIIFFARIDYFWMHFGHIGDRIWKHFSWNIAEHFGYQIPYYRIAQTSTILIITGLLVSLRRYLPTFRIELLTVVILILLQVGFLGYMTLSNIPQVGDYGIDKKIWVFIEEARYYNFLTFLIMMGICFLTYRYQKPTFYIILIFILSGSVPRLDFWNSKFPYILQRYESMRNSTNFEKNTIENSKEDINVEKIFYWRAK